MTEVKITNLTDKTITLSDVPERVVLRQGETDELLQKHLNDGGISEESFLAGLKAGRAEGETELKRLEAIIHGEHDGCSYLASSVYCNKCGFHGTSAIRPLPPGRFMRPSENK